MNDRFPRAVLDQESQQREDIKALKAAETPNNIPFNANKIGHVVLMVSDLERSTEFYTKVLGFRVSDVYPESMMPGRMVFMRCNRDHHGVALVGGAPSNSSNLELHHMAFEVSTIDEVLKAREHLIKNNVQIQFDGRRRAGAQVAVEFLDPDGHWLEIFWGLDQIAPDAKARPPEEWVEVFSLEDAIDNPPLGQNIRLKDLKLRKN